MTLLNKQLGMEWMIKMVVNLEKKEDTTLDGNESYTKEVTWRKERKQRW